MEKRLLCAFAHPDDESFGPSGTIAQIVADPGARVRLVIATRGEAGTIGISKRYEPGELARIRQGEMIEAARRLGAELFFLGYPDRRVSLVPPEMIVTDLIREIRLSRPQALLTFHPNGISAHPDHLAMTAALRAAFDVAADPGQCPECGPPWRSDRLFYHALTPRQAGAIAHSRAVETIPEEEVDLALDVLDWLPRKHAACLAHGTQLDFYNRLQAATGGLDAFWATEHHVLGAWRGAKPAGLAGLFDGLGEGQALTSSRSAPAPAGPRPPRG